ncbi:MAG: sensor histidine kinase KdpD [Thermomicrobiales bacterium]
MTAFSDQHLDSPYRGELRILLGAAPGVGKTYAMLNEGRRLLAEGQDVVIGYVETHGRADTKAQIGDLEIVAPRMVVYGTLSMPEMDVERIIQRSPSTVLIDELAHTNAPGSSRSKRYQDVEFIRDQGIDVITTVNVQHLAELQDVIASVTGIEVREAIPDHVLDGATDIQLVDLPVEVLLRRLEQGKIYPQERANQALTSFFKQGNLTALRELALRRTTEGVDDRLALMMLGAQSTNLPTERILVLVSTHDRWSIVLRNAWRLASATRADLLTLTLAPDGEIGRYTAGNLAANDTQHQLAQDLGARVIVASDESGSLQDQAEAISRVVREERITIVVGGIEPGRSRLRFAWQGLDILTELMKRCDGLDVHMVKLPERD